MGIAFNPKNIDQLPVINDNKELSSASINNKVDTIAGKRFQTLTPSNKQRIIAIQNCRKQLGNAISSSTSQALVKFIDNIVTITTNQLKDQFLGNVRIWFSEQIGDLRKLREERSTIIANTKEEPKSESISSKKEESVRRSVSFKSEIFIRQHRGNTKSPQDNLQEVLNALKNCDKQKDYYDDRTALENYRDELFRRVIENHGGSSFEKVQLVLEASQNKLYGINNLELKKLGQEVLEKAIQQAKAPQDKNDTRAPFEKLKQVLNAIQQNSHLKFPLLEKYRDALFEQHLGLQDTTDKKLELTLQAISDRRYGDNNPHLQALREQIFLQLSVEKKPESVLSMSPQDAGKILRQRLTDSEIKKGWVITKDPLANKLFLVIDENVGNPKKPEFLHHENALKIEQEGTLLRINNMDFDEFMNGLVKDTPPNTVSTIRSEDAQKEVEVSRISLETLISPWKDSKVISQKRYPDAIIDLNQAIGNKYDKTSADPIGYIVRQDGANKLEIITAKPAGDGSTLKYRNIAILLEGEKLRLISDYGEGWKGPREWSSIGELLATADQNCGQRVDELLKPKPAIQQEPVKPKESETSIKLKPQTAASVELLKFTSTNIEEAQKVNPKMVALLKAQQVSILQSIIKEELGKEAATNIIVIGSKQDAEDTLRELIKNKNEHLLRIDPTNPSKAFIISGIITQEGDVRITEKDLSITSIGNILYINGKPFEEFIKGLPIRK